MEVINMIEFYTSELSRVGVTVHLNSDGKDMDPNLWDTVLLATGTESAPPGADVVQMMSTGMLPSQREVTVYGDTEVALFAALWLAENGRSVSLISPAASVAMDTNDMQRGHLTELLQNLGGTIITHGTLSADDQVIMACTRTPSTLHAALVDDYRVQSIGTRARGGRMYEATQSGFWSAARTGEAL